VRKHYPDQDSTSIKPAPRPSIDGLVTHEDRRWGADTMEIIKKAGKEDLAELKLINASHGFILFSPHQALALDHLERFFGKHFAQTHE
jgi:hypothetical protein